MEERIITGKLNPHIDPALSIWEWQIPVYLFLGGLTAGIMILGALSVLRGDGRGLATQRLMLAVPVLLAVGMFALFLDLSNKVHVWRFYTAFQITAPMSWGAWILLLVVPVNLLLLGGLARTLWPAAYERFMCRTSCPWRPLVPWAARRLRPLAYANVAVGVALGIYTGILLSAYGARPFWNSAILGPIFLVSGLSSAAALVQWVSRDASERARYGRVDVLLIMVEIGLIALLLVNMASGPALQREAAGLLFGGPLTTYFWVFVVGLGLLLPLYLEVVHLRGRLVPHFLAPLLVLAGGLIFRFFVVEAGQLTTWISY